MVRKRYTEEQIIFMSIRHAREIIEAWRKDYNGVRPHSSLGGLAPKEFMEIAGRI